MRSIVPSLVTETLDADAPKAIDRAPPEAASVLVGSMNSRPGEPEERPCPRQRQGAVQVEARALGELEELPVADAVGEAAGGAFPDHAVGAVGAAVEVGCC